MAISYDYYRCFYYVAKYRSFTKAANILGSGQPNITRTINRLEAELGCRLLSRSQKGVTLTYEGEQLFRHVQIAQEHFQAAEAEIFSAKNLQTGNLTIGATAIAMHGKLLPVLKEFRHRYPGVHIHVTNLSTPQAMSMVKNGEIEFAIVTSPSRAGRDFLEIPLESFQTVLIAGHAFASLADKPLHFKDLTAYPFVGLSTNTRTHEFYEELFRQSHVSLVPDIDVSTADQILPMVANDLGLGLIPHIIAQEALNRNDVIELKLADKIPERQICMIRDKNRPMSAAAIVLERMLTEGNLETE